MDLAATPTNGFIEINVHCKVEQAIVDKSLFETALGIAYIITRLVEREGDAMIVE